MQFLERILHPLTRISSDTDLMNFMALSDVSCHSLNLNDTLFSAGTGIGEPG